MAIVLNLLLNYMWKQERVPQSIPFGINKRSQTSKGISSHPKARIKYLKNSKSWKCPCANTSSVCRNEGCAMAGPESFVDIRLVGSRGSFYPDVLFRGSSMEQIKFKMKLELAASHRRALCSAVRELHFRRSDAQTVIMVGFKW